MAKVLSGSFNTTAYGERYLTFSWSATQDTAKNQSTISWSLKGAGGSTTSYYMSAPFSVVIAGEEVYTSSTRIQLKNGTTVASGTKVISHKADGTKSFSASVKAAIYSGSYNVSGSGTWDLKDIPRAAKITSASNFNDEGNPTIKYSNALGNGAETLQAAITLNQDGTGVAAAYRNITKTGTSYTFSLTDAERNILRNNCTTAKSRKVYFYIKTVIGGVSYTNNMEATLTIVNANPTLTAVAKDTGAASTALTGDNQKMIKGFNYVNVALTATALKGATIKSYTITNGGNTVSEATGNFNNTEDNKFVCVVKDSRGNTTTITKELTMINYTKLTAAADISMAVNGSSSDLATLTVKLSGNYFNGSFGAVNNTLRFEIYEEQVETGLNYTGDKPISTFSGNTYSHTYTDDTLPYENSWKVRVRVYDKISSITLPERVVSAKPVFDWSDKDFNFNVPITINGLPFQSVVNAMTERYYLPTTITAGTNYSAEGTSDAILVGNNLRCYFKATRSAATTGNITNEKICTLTINHGGKLKNMYDGGITPSSAGPVASYYLQAVSWDNDNNTVSFDVMLAAVATSYADFSGMFTIPVVINLNAY